MGATREITPIMQDGPEGSLILWFSNEADAVSCVTKVWRELAHAMDEGRIPRRNLERLIARCPVLDRETDLEDWYAVLQRTDTLEGSDQ